MLSTLAKLRPTFLNKGHQYFQIPIPMLTAEVEYREREDEINNKIPCHHNVIYFKGKNTLR